MEIELIEFASLTIPRKERFTIARGSSDVAETWWVFVHAGGLVGQGCGAPSEVTHETAATMNESLKALVKGLKGYEFHQPHEIAERMDKLVPGNPAAKAALDMAVYDLAAQVAGLPLYRYLGGHRDRMTTDMTIGIMPTPAAVEHAVRWTHEGFRALKVKVGQDPKMDLDRLAAIRSAVGPNVELRIDGNEGFTWGQALSFARAARDLNVAFFEQPVPAQDLEGMRVLAESSPVPIMADEMVLTPEDAKKVRWGNAAKAVNLKLMKHGGIARALEVDTICSSAGYPTMVGCMSEPQLSIAAGLHFALASPNVKWLDLDSHFNLASDPSSGLEFKHGHLVAPSKPGLGIDVRWPG
ncbi:MAG TPA: dipeptide epimerase [Thermoplasmata archaeon]|nr:dipeptide epimerase [Thermoplasmata archaeon]